MQPLMHWVYSAQHLRRWTDARIGILYAYLHGAGERALPLYKSPPGDVQDTPRTVDVDVDCVEPLPNLQHGSRFTTARLLVVAVPLRGYSLSILCRITRSIRRRFLALHR